jgi:hypothetical protein
MKSLDVMTIPPAGAGSTGTVRWSAALAVILFLVFWNIDAYPLTWFDEGAHVEAARLLATTGRFAGSNDASGSAQSVGPTVSVPIAIAFRCCGQSLRSARLVMAGYLVATIATWYLLARQLGSVRFAAAAVALLIADPSVGLLELGRQAMGEVPGLFYLSAALCVWLWRWPDDNWRRLVPAGCLFGLAAITKPQYLVMVAGGLGLAWFVNLLYFRKRQSLFFIPAVSAGLCVILWNVFYLWQLADAQAELRLIGGASRSIGFFVPAAVIKENVIAFIVPGYLYAGWLLPALVYAATLTVTRDDAGQKWSILWLIAAVNLAWFVQSVGWLRYAFPGLALAGLFVAACFDRLTDSFRLDRVTFPIGAATARRLALLVWFGMLIVPRLKTTVGRELWPPFNAPVAIASYIDSRVPPDEMIETYEAEVPILSRRRYHLPPPQLQEVAILHSLGQAQPPYESYSPLQRSAPRFVLLGKQGRDAKIYSTNVLRMKYRVDVTIGPYELYERLAKAGR